LEQLLSFFLLAGCEFNFLVGWAVFLADAPILGTGMALVGVEMASFTEQVARFSSCLILSTIITLAARGTSVVWADKECTQAAMKGAFIVDVSR